jgi:hydroxymethylbilane synthase
MAGATIRVGTRGSRLALIQTELTLAILREARPNVLFEVVTVTTQGDANQTAPLAGMGLGVFVKEIERLLEIGEIDMAVHSLKDMPTVLPEGMALGAILERADPRDALVSHLGKTLDEFPAGAKIGTSSPRRQAQIAERRPDLEIVPIRGNVDTRLRKAAGEECDGTVIAVAGLDRMGLADVITEYLSPEEFVPPPGQGAMAVEIRADDKRTAELVASADHAPTTAAVNAERSFLEALGGGCQVPVGAYAEYDDSDALRLTVFMATPDGSATYRATVTGASSDPAGLAAQGWENLRERGAAGLLTE